MISKESGEANFLEAQYGNRERPKTAANEGVVIRKYFHRGFTQPSHVKSGRPIDVIKVAEQIGDKGTFSHGFTNPILRVSECSKSDLRRHFFARARHQSHCSVMALDR